MVTCRQLMKLESFAGIPILAGRDGLDRIVSWPYAKHTKVVAPWVRGGEFLLISGYEVGVNEDELLEIIGEAAVNRLSGILVEGGVNFKVLSPRVIQLADKADMPLFFTSGVVSFVDVTKDISRLILEDQMVSEQDASLFERLLDTEKLTAQEYQSLLDRAGFQEDEKFFVAHFSFAAADEKDEHAAGMTSYLAKDILRMVDALLKNLKRKTVSRSGSLPTSYVTFLLYYQEDSDPAGLRESLTRICSRTAALYPEHIINVSFSRMALGIAQVSEGVNQAYFVAQLQKRRLLQDGVRSFGDIGSYQLLFYVDKRDCLIDFRDSCLGQLHAVDMKGSSQLTDTLRVFLLNNGNTLKTAASLVIHRNTLQYRLDRISAILHRDLADPCVKRDLLNAFMILNLFPFSDAENAQ